MKARAIYGENEHEDNRVTHWVEHDGGSFVVSSKEVGVAVQNFMNLATETDVVLLHGNLLSLYRTMAKEAIEAAEAQA